MAAEAPGAGGGWKRWARDKRVWAGVAVVAAVAVVATIRNRGAAAGSATNPVGQGNAQGYWAAGNGSADTTGTDLSGFLSNWARSQNEAQTEFFKSLTDALNQGGPSQNDDQPPSVVWSRDSSGKPFWAVLNSPYGGWMQTDSQSTANSWASQWETDEVANSVDWATWEKLKAKWNK